ncbi:DmpA family aminopeptidase [Pseudofrankia inefficax]|uniref:Peptidase S58 DmpA n=1 Tax=Pseudofrankia inefficax (strain DSM 45817 / CECT 9037 / DDB 130130 / EuI1c) TaxID=298654 RepID=E3J5Q9_PSEI1|nr:P1 family peptidase [Pseudofrankia inefficax]ADP83146.1 peptidase S58 DmpA [Pseudofrankia inefficax]
MAEPRRRAREHGIPFDGTPGPFNAITDVPGVEVGYTTLISGDGPLRVGDGPVRTGVTAILPAGRGGIGSAVAAGVHAFNANGEMTGNAWLAETGSLSLPVMITNTHAIGPCHRGVIDWVVANRPDLARGWLLPVVAETWDGYLNDINGAHVTPAHAVAAIDAAVGGPVPEGAVGGGTGMMCYGFKGGSGTASRIVPYGPDTYTVAAFVQANFGRRDELRIAGVPVGRLLADADADAGARGWDGDWAAPPGAGSCIAVLATDAPLLPGQCASLARRAPLGLARTGTTGSHFSGDLVLAFSTANRGALTSAFPTADPTADDYAALRFIPWGRLDAFYEAAVQAVEEAVVNVLTTATSLTGRDNHHAQALPVGRVEQLLSRGSR